MYEIKTVRRNIDINNFEIDRQFGVNVQVSTDCISESERKYFSFDILLLSYFKFQGISILIIVVVII